MIEIHSLSEVTDHLAGLKAVIFDMDDTLYGEKEYVRSGYRAVAAELPTVAAAEDRLWRLFEDGKNAIDELLTAEGLYTEELKARCLRAYRFHQPSIRLYDGAERLLKQLRGEGYFLGVITDGRPEGQRAKLAALGLETLTDEIIVTDELGGVGYRKPHPRAFERMRAAAEARLEHVAYGEMCYIGDNVAKDFTAPEALGMRSIWYRNPDGLYTGR